MQTARAAAILCVLAGACTEAEETGAPSEPGPGATSPAGEPSPADGMVRGTVRLAGTVVPEPSVIENATDPEVCGRTQRVDDLLVDAESRGIANVIVSLSGIPAEQVGTPQPSRLVLDNRDCQFVPRVAVLTVGSTIEAVSHDQVLHTTHLYGAVEHNFALPYPSEPKTATVEEPGMIAVLCDVHGWMKAYVRVDSHPFHAVTDADGTFLIANVPPGDYELDVWHERLGRQSLPVHVQRGADDDELEILYALDDEADRAAYQAVSGWDHGAPALPRSIRARVSSTKGSPEARRSPPNPPEPTTDRRTP